ncbi:hypothetical protein Q7P37_003139 [Cladosporium fusiforme]
MYKFILFTVTFTLVVLSSVATANNPHARAQSKIEALTQAGHKLSHILDTKNYSALDSVLTQDVVLDATDLQPVTGGETNGFDETVSVFKLSGAGAKTAHRITNVLLLDEITPKKARVSSYIAYSHWVEDALDDSTKTWRIYYRCDDIWVLEDSIWKLQYSKVYNMGYGAEAPYYGKEE